MARASLGVQSFDQRRGAFEVGKEGRDGLALTVCTATGSQR